MEPIHYRFEIAFKSSLAPENALRYLFGMLTANRSVFMAASDSLSITPLLSDPVDAHGEHGMADRLNHEPIRAVLDIARVAGLVVDAPRPAPLHQPEECAATCSCYMGAAAQPFAHEPSCALHPRFVHPRLSNGDETNR